MLKSRRQRVTQSQRQSQKQNQTECTLTDVFLNCAFADSELLSYVDQGVDQATVDGSGHDLILWLNLLGESECRPQASVWQ